MNHLEVKTLILGATFYGCGLARNMPDALIMESSIAPGSNRVYGFEPGTGWQEPLTHPEAEEFRQELLQRHALTPEGRLLTGALAPVFAAWCLRRNLPLLLGVRLVARDDHSAQFLDCCGNRIECCAEQIIDARETLQGEKFLTAVLVSPEVAQEGKYGEFELCFSGIDHIYYAMMRLEEACSLQDARKRFFSLWQKRPESLRQLKLLLTASRFSRRNYRNAAAELEAGLLNRTRRQSQPLHQRKVPDSCDLIVAGFGTAGSAAAVAAARRGLRVMVVERNTCPGGTWTGGFVPKCYLQEPTGIAKEFQEAASRIKDCFGITEPLKIVQERAADACGVEIHYGAQILSVLQEDRQICGMQWLDADGNVHTTRTTTIIDGTAEAVVCRLAGCELNRGRNSDHEFNRYTNSMGVFRGGNFGVDNVDAGRIAQYDVENFSRVYLSGFLCHLRDDFRKLPVCIVPSDLPGIREGERILPEAPYTLSEFFSRHGKTPEPLFHVFSNLDTHANDPALEQELFQDWLVASSLWEQKLVIPIPRRVLFPRHISGLIAAGRHLGVDHELGCAVRMIPAMAAIGEAAGMIAAHAFRAEIPPDTLPYSAFAAELPSQDVPAANRAWYGMPLQEIRTQLASSAPGLALWNARQQGRSEELREWFAQAAPGSLLRSHCAMGLALLNDSTALPELMKLAMDRDSEVLNPAMAHSHTRRTAAIYLLGRLRAAEAAPLLERMLKEKSCDSDTPFLIASLLKISDSREDTRASAAQLLRRLAEDPAWMLTEPLNGQKGKSHRVDGLFRLHIARMLDRWGIPHQIAATATRLPLDAHETWLWQHYKI